MSAGEVFKTGLIVVDLQHAFDPPPELVGGIRAILPEYGVIVATQFLNKAKSLYETQLNYTRCQIGSKESEIVIPLKPQSVFDRFSYGLQAVHIERLKQYPVASWDIVGCDTEACVLATCYNLWDHGIPFRVRKELCHSSGGAAQQEAAFRIMKRSFGQ